ncbi:MAG TPA: NAD(P)-dependent alcohol dehydrogenase, partial [Pseudolabrys sp.]|nr:NAD(P)-dependent alcohol dehydrogenase [Pseudolabrys sp.]
MISYNAAVVREKGGAFKIECVALDKPRDNEVLVRIAGVGVCHTDLVVRDQYFPTPLPAILGHEGAGVVEMIGSGVTKVAVGDHVVLSYASCGACTNCQSGKYTYCLDLYGRNFSGGRPDGSSPCCDAHGNRLSAYFFSQSSFGELALATERNVVTIPKDVPLDIMGPLGCGIQTGAGAVINALKPSAGTSIAIFGAGSVGLAAVMAARIVGCAQIIAVDINDGRLALAKELGATDTINGGKEDAVEAIRQITGGEGAQYSLECTGLPKVARQAVDCLRLTGVCGIIGAAPLGTEVAFDMNGLL